MDAIALARALSVARAGIGVAMMAAPTRAVEGWIGADAARPGTQVVTRSFGAREAFVGFLGAHVAGRPGVGRRSIATLGALDAFDVVASVAGRRALPGRGVAAIAALAGGSAVAHALVARRLPEA